MRTYALDDIRVVDLAGYIAGAYASGLLADLGAHVDKVESFEGDAFRGIVAGFQSWNRGKRGIVLNLRTDEGREVLHRMVRRADVVLENYRQGVAQRLGADYETLKRVNPRIVYCTVTAYGTQGSYAGVPGFDPLFQAQSGAMAYQGGVPDHPEGSVENPPVFLRVAISDYTAAITAAWGVCMALYHRRRTGEGQRVETALMNSVIATQPGEFLFQDGVPWSSPRVDSLGTDATHRLYRAKDGWLYLACDTPEQWKVLCDAIEKPEVASLWVEDGARRDDAITQALASELGGRPAGHWIRALEHSKLKVTELRTTREFSRDESNLEQGLTLEIESPEYGRLRQSKPPFGFSRTPGTVRRPAPVLGQHTAEILGELGYREAEVQTLREKRVVP